jgi:hypothetical protein
MPYVPLIVLAVLAVGAVPASAQQPQQECGGEDPAPLVINIPPTAADVANVARWAGDYYGRNVPGGADPLGDSRPAPITGGGEPAPPPQPAQPASDRPPYAVDGGAVAGTVGDWTTRGAWWLGTWAGTSEPPQLGPGSNAAPATAPAPITGGPSPTCSGCPTPAGSMLR